MAAITKSSVKIRSRWIRTRTIIYCVVVIIVCFGMIRGSIFTNRDFLSDPSEKYGLLSSIPIKSINNNDEKANSNRAGAVVVSNNINTNNNKKKAVSSSSSSKELEIEQPKQLDFPKSNKDHFHNPATVDNREDIYIYHHTLRSSAGKEGAVVLDMLMGHAFAYQQGAIYGGSCGEGNDVGRDPENSLIKAIGLQDFIQFACPRDLESVARKKTVPENSYKQDGTRIFNPEYMDKMKSVIRYPVKQDSSKTNIIVVHISRGKKITPCRKALHQGYEPYLPNKHYQLLINKYTKPDQENKVILYSQSEHSFETFDEFREKGYELHIDEPIDDVWRAVMTSDVFIMSRSSFSFVPAMAVSGSTSTTVVYTPYWLQPIRGWEIVRKDIQAQSDVDFQRLKLTCPKKTNLMGRRKTFDGDIE